MYRYTFRIGDNCELFEEILWGLGAQSISSEKDQSFVTVLFEDPDYSEIVNTCGEIPLSVDKITEDQWKNTWFENYSGTMIENVIILPYTKIPNNSLKTFSEINTGENNKITIYLDPRESFGSGEHPSTIVAVKLICSIFRLSRGGLTFTNKNYFSKILDIGTGTGILSILAEKLGALEINAVDNSPDACRKAANNFMINDCKHVNLVNSSITEYNPQISFDMIFSNILCELHEQIADKYFHLLSDKGFLIISGITDRWEKHLFSLLSKNGFRLSEKCNEGEWCGAVFVKQ